MAPLADATIGLLPALLIALVVAGLVAGWVGVLVASVTTVAARVAEPRLPEIVPWLLGGCAFVAAFAYYFRPWADSCGWAGNASWPHYLVLVPVVACLVLSARRRPRSLSRMAGASMTAVSQLRSRQR